MESKRKVVDLIYIEPQKDESTVLKEYNFSLDHWKKALKTLQEQYFEKHYDSASPDVLEILNMRKFLGKFLQSRLDWVANSVSDANLRRRYLNVIPPFQQKGGVKTLLLHFYQVVESEKTKSLIYKPKNEIEKEVSILWDIYKLKKTIESIETMLRSLDQPEAFKSTMSVEDRKNCLTSLKTAFQLMYQMSIRKEVQKELYSTISADVVSIDAIVARREQGISYVYPHVIKKYDYRNHFFYVYFFPGMKAKIGGEIKEFRFNYLDFELIKQEFLIDWMNKKLQGNQNKKKVYSRYSIGGVTVDKIVEQDPSKEIEILQKLPISVFNDITAEVNDAVSDELKTSVEAFSENQGQFARENEKFEEAEKITKSPFDKLKNLIATKKPEPVAEEPVPEPEAEEEEEKVSFEVIKIKKNQIDFPFFQKESSTYKQKFSLMKIKLGPAYQEYQKKLSAFFANVSETAVVKRRTPKHEIIYPCMVKETRGANVINHLVLFGAEIKSKQLSMSYSSKSSDNPYQYTCFFVYGCDQPHDELGASNDKRFARGVEFQIYDFTNKEVQARINDFFQLIMGEK